MYVQRRWYELALPHLWCHFEFSVSSDRDLRRLGKLVTDGKIRQCLFGGDSSCSLTNFTLVRSLSLSVNLGGNGFQSEPIASVLTNFNALLVTCTGLRDLRLHIQPFSEPTITAIPLELRVPSQNNRLLEDLVQHASQGDYATLFLDISLQRWRYEERTADRIRQYIRLLAPQITSLRLVETASASASLITPLSRLRRLEFDNLGNPGIESCAAFWDVLESLPLEDLALSGFILPLRRFERWHRLRSLRLNRCGNLEEAMSISLRSFPDLRSLSFHDPLPEALNTFPAPLTEIVCTNLRKIIFTHCRAQKNLLSRIAESCPQLQICMPPDNASDLDIITLIDSCPYLTALLIDGCAELTSVSIHHLPRAGRLRSLLFNFQHLVSLDEECISALSEKCPDFTQSRIPNYNDGSQG